MKLKRPDIILGVIRAILTQLMPWLEEEAKKTETPIDDNIVRVLKMLLES